MIFENNIFFFIYDENVMKSEYDILEDAVIYYHPKHFMSSNEMYLLIGQLVGMATFSEEISGSLISVLTLKSLKFTVHRHSHFLLFMGTDHHHIPDLSLQKKLSNFVDKFKFFHGSLKRLLKRNENNYADFLLDLDLICNKYLSQISSASQTVQSIFTPINKLHFDKSRSKIFTSASHLLESCQQKEKILCGCIISENKLVYSQLPWKLLHPLLQFEPNLNNQVAWRIYGGYVFPFGINIFKCFLSKENCDLVLKQSLLSPYKRIDVHSINQFVSSKSIRSESFLKSKLEESFSASLPTINDEKENDDNNPTCTCRFQVKNVFTSKFFGAPNEANSNLDRFPIVHHCKQNKVNQIGLQQNLILDEETQITESHNEVSETQRSETCIKENYGAITTNNKEEKHNKNQRSFSVGLQVDSTTINNSSIPTDENDETDINNEIVVNNVTSQNIEKHFETKRNDVIDNDLVSYTKERVADFVLNSTMEKELKLSERGDLPTVIHKSQISEQRPTNNTNEEIVEENLDDDVCDDMQEFHLFIQSHSNTTLFLFLSPSEKYAKDEVKELGEMVFPVLGDIEARIKSSSDSDEPNNSASKKSEHSLCLRYDQINSSLQENVGNSENEEEFLTIVDQLHTQFQNAAQFYDVTLKSNSTTIYAHQSPFDEIYIQPRGNYRPTQGAPNNTDIAWRLDQSLSRKSDRNKIASYEGCKFVKSIF